MTTQLTAQQRASIDQMYRDHGRHVGTRWCGINHSITHNCRSDAHEKCHGWVNPIYGQHICHCPCHDEDRPSHQRALAFAIEALGMWNIGHVVTMPGTDLTFTVEFINYKTQQMCCLGSDGGNHILPIRGPNLVVEDE